MPVRQSLTATNIAFPCQYYPLANEWRDTWLYPEILVCVGKASYPKVENLATLLGIFLGKSLKKEQVMTLRNIELLSSCVSLSFTSRLFPAFLNCYKTGKPSKSKFALNSIFTILALARFSLVR